MVFIRVQFKPGIDEKADQPNPDGTLVIGSITLYFATSSPQQDNVS
jgi:hypothetical protein